MGSGWDPDAAKTLFNPVQKWQTQLMTSLFWDGVKRFKQRGFQPASHCVYLRLYWAANYRVEFAATPKSERNLFCNALIVERAVCLQELITDQKDRRCAIFPHIPRWQSVARSRVGGNRRGYRRGRRDNSRRGWRQRRDNSQSGWRQRRRLPAWAAG